MSTWLDLRNSPGELVKEWSIFFSFCSPVAIASGHPMAFGNPRKLIVRWTVSETFENVRCKMCMRFANSSGVAIGTIASLSSIRFRYSSGLPIRSETSARDRPALSRIVEMSRPIGVTGSFSDSTLCWSAESCKRSFSFLLMFGGVKKQDEIETRDAFDEALIIPQLYELAVQAGYLPEDAVRAPARKILTNLTWSAPARRFIEAYDYVTIPMLAARVGVRGFVSSRPPKTNPTAALRFAGFLAHLRDFHRDEKIQTWVAFLDDYVVEDREQDLLWEFLRGRRKKPPSRIRELLMGCRRFVSSLATAFHIMSDEELGPYGLMHAYWLQKFFGYKRNEKGDFVKNDDLWGQTDSWARTLSTSSRLVPEKTDKVIKALVRRQFIEQIVLLEHTFSLVRKFTRDSRRPSKYLRRTISE